jgi:hypothetical protein
MWMIQMCEVCQSKVLAIHGSIAPMEETPDGTVLATLSCSVCDALYDLVVTCVILRDSPKGPVYDIVHRATPGADRSVILRLRATWAELDGEIRAREAGEWDALTPDQQQAKLAAWRASELASRPAGDPIERVAASLEAWGHIVKRADPTQVITQVEEARRRRPDA